MSNSKKNGKDLWKKAIATSKEQPWDPELCINLLKIPSSLNYSSITKMIRSAPKSWLVEFLELGGLGALLESLERLSSNGSKTSVAQAYSQVQCVSCLRAVINSEHGLSYISEQPHYSRQLANIISCGSKSVKLQVFELLCALCLFSPEGNQLAMLVLQNYKQNQGGRHRMDFVVNELLAADTIAYQRTLMAFVNCIILGQRDDVQRIFIRNELFGSGLGKALLILEEIDDEALQIQLDAFHKHQTSDDKEMEPLSHHQLFDTLYKQVADTPKSVSLQYLLFYLTQLDRNRTNTDKVWEMLEDITTGENKHRRNSHVKTRDCGTQTFARSRLSRRGSDSKAVQTQDIPESDSNQARVDAISITDSTSHRDIQTSTIPEEAEGLKVDGQTDGFSSIPSPPPMPVSPNSIPRPPPFPNIPDDNYLSSIPPPPPLPVGSVPPLPSFNSAPPPPPLPNYAAPCPPPMPNCAAPCPPPLPNCAVPPPPPMPYCAAPPPPPFPNCDVPPPPPLPTHGVPPPPSMNGIPPPPPMNGVPPPPPMNGVPPPPLMNGVPPPPPMYGVPPPPPMNGHVPSVDSLFTPMSVPINGYSTLPSRKLSPSHLMHKYNTLPRPSKKMKTINWTKVPPQVIDKSLWSNVDTPSVSIDFKQMEELFCQKTKSAQPIVGGNLQPKGPTLVNLIDSKRSLAVNILLKQFKQGPQQVLDAITKCQPLPQETLRALMRLLPEQSELALIKSHRGGVETLGCAEKFYLDLSKIPHYEPRIKAMLMKEECPTIIAENEPVLQSMLEVSNSLMENKNLEKFFGLVLQLGNYLNAGSYAGNASGFKLNTLPKLFETRANKPRMTFLHYCVEVAMSHDKNMLNFIKDASKLRDAARVPLSAVEEEINLLSKDLKKLEKQIKDTNKEIRSQFSEFFSRALDDIKRVEEEIKKVKKASKKLALHYCEDPDKFQLEESFLLFVDFYDKIQKANAENESRKKQEEQSKKIEMKRNNSTSNLTTNLDTLSSHKKRNSLQMQKEEVCLVDLLMKEIKEGTFKLRRSQPVCA